MELLKEKILKEGKALNTEVLKVDMFLNQQVDTGPGKHTSYTVADGVPVIGLSGPTGCTHCTSEWYVRPVIAPSFSI